MEYEIFARHIKELKIIKREERRGAREYFNYVNDIHLHLFSNNSAGYINDNSKPNLSFDVVLEIVHVIFVDYHHSGPPIQSRYIRVA